MLEKPNSRCSIRRVRSLNYWPSPSHWCNLKVRDVIRRIELDGWYRVPARSGHRQYKHPIKRGRVTVAGKLNVDVPPETLKSIWRQAQLPEIK